MSSRRNADRPANGDTLPDGAAFFEAFAEPLDRVMDLNTWRGVRDPADEFRRIEAEVERAIEAETAHQREIRQQVFPLLADSGPPGSGLHTVTPREVIETQQGLLFAGCVEACDGTNQTHDTLPLTIHQIGIALVSYRGELENLQTRLFRRDLRNHRPDALQAALDLLARRAGRAALDHENGDPLSELAQRGLMSYAERALLTDRSAARWRMGHGSPAPLELIGAQFTDLVIESIKVIRRLVEFKRFIFVASEPADRMALSFGQGLHPLEYLIVGTLKERIEPYLKNWSQSNPATVDLEWDGVKLRPKDWVCRFRDEVAPNVVYGLYRATPLAPPQLFYAHAEMADVAARIAIADSVFDDVRGFPMLIDLADRVCRAVYGGHDLRRVAEAVYAANGAPFRYQSERPTRTD